MPSFARQDYVSTDSRLPRSAEVDRLLPNVLKARTMLDWESRVKFGRLARMKVDVDLAVEPPNAAVPYRGGGRRVTNLSGGQPMVM